MISAIVSAFYLHAIIPWIVGLVVLIKLKGSSKPFTWYVPIAALQFIPAAVLFLAVVSLGHILTSVPLLAAANTPNVAYTVITCVLQGLFVYLFEKKLG